MFSTFDSAEKDHLYNLPERVDRCEICDELLDDCKDVERRYCDDCLELFQDKTLVFSSEKYLAWRKVHENLPDEVIAVLREFDGMMNHDGMSMDEMEEKYICTEEWCVEE